MALTDIATTANIELQLGTALAAADTALLGAIRLRVEAQIRQYVRWTVTQATHTHVLPRWRQDSNELQLPEPFVSSITTVHEDYNARGGSNAADFAAANLLTIDTDYWLDTEITTLGHAGILRRYQKNWPMIPRTVKVVYVAGFTSTQLDDEFHFVREAVFNETLMRYNYAKQGQNVLAGTGTVTMERLKDYTVRYADTSSMQEQWNSPSGLLGRTESSLDPIVYYGEML
jgi:hypothetical protein